MFSFCNRFFLCVTLLVFSSFSVIGSHKEEFYIFDVGQGNSQFAVYKSGIGILYDCGSSSSQIHPKIASLQDYELNTFFGRKKPELKQITNLVQEHKILVPKEDFLEEESGVIEEKNSQRKSSDSSQTLSNKDSFALKNREENIRDIIFQHQLKHLFIILSHPDKDHINFINKYVIPEKLPVTAFLFGDWLGKGGENSKGNALSEDVSDVLAFLRSRENTWVELPHYWDGLKTIKAKINYTEIKDRWLSDLSNSFKDTYDFCKKGTVTAKKQDFKLFDVFCEIFHRTFYNISDSDRDKLSFHVSTSLDILETFLGDKLYQHDMTSIFRPDNTQMSKDLKQISIYYTSRPFTDVNSQSAILRLKMPDLKMQIICTGDAHEETFSDIAEMQTYKNDFPSYISKDEALISLVMLPHHGSLENKSYSLFQLFKPDILGIPAGNGGMYSHPSRQLIKELGKELEEENYQTNFYNLFEEVGTTPNDFIYFYDEELSKEEILSKKKKERIARLHLHKQENERGYVNIPIVCTNVHGTIKIDRDGFKSPFASTIETEEGDHYLIDYNSRVMDKKLIKEIEELLKQKFKKYVKGELKGSDLVFIKDVPYYGVLTKDNTYVYDTVKKHEF